MKMVRGGFVRSERFLRSFCVSNLFIGALSVFRRMGCASDFGPDLFEPRDSTGVVAKDLVDFFGEIRDGTLNKNKSIENHENDDKNINDGQENVDPSLDFIMSI